jgi:hypothetical protein
VRRGFADLDQKSAARRYRKRVQIGDWSV